MRHHATHEKPVHTVYFNLQDHSPQSRAHFIKLCFDLLAGHEGELKFILGHRNDDIHRDVSDINYDVAMTIVFDSLEHYKAYDQSPRHDRFRDEISKLHCTVRVFDSFSAA